MICSECSAAYEISDTEKAFHTEMGVPAPNQCPHCRFVRRLTVRNARNLYKRTCDLSGKDFISPYASVPFPVYHPDVWFSDDWDDLSFGKDIDLSRPFFDQLLELHNVVPKQGQFICPGTIENSDYVNCAGYLKDCYLIAETDYNERCLYGNRMFHNEYVVDCSNITNSELCYECIDVRKCHTCLYSRDCENCSDSYFIKNCIGSRNCIGCMNLRQKQYCIFNEQYTKEEYEQKKTELALHTFSGIEAMRKQAEEFFTTQPNRYVQMEQVQNCSGDHLYDSKNATECVDCSDLEDCMYCARAFTVKSAIDYTSWGDKSEKMFTCGSCGDNCYNLRYCATCTTNCSDLTYCTDCTGCKNCFGCIGMKKKQHCILNTQYSKEEYERLRDQLIEHMKMTPLRSSDGSFAGYEWGEYFPKTFCSFGYNETIAMEYFAVTKEEALAKGYSWKDPEDIPMNVTKTIDANRLPEGVADVPDDVLNWAVVCSVSNRPFKIIKQELEFYRQLNIPIPHLHPDERHNRRMTLRPSRVFHDRTCDGCNSAIRTTFAPEKPEKVLCESCYLNQVY